MSVSQDLLFQNLSTVQNKTQPQPKNIGAATATITPTTFLTVTSAGVPVTYITPPIDGCHVLAVYFADVAGVGVVAPPNGNIGTAKASVAGEVMLLVYNPVSGLYYPVG